ncbi:hypothetical protein E4U57_004852 [Claviceps arundinis]|uniref:Uncharacterized protein n=1 Tax=Claviceps arundinis TaxID=1623583 RepID=A0A9P7MU64_9HYPO|nr:hypothetical protein E4U57_004852 [Claviceps arundinis]KAG5967881.1 hypothetical protein E4U56_000634 [Claviceps arundinis]
MRFSLVVSALAGLALADLSQRDTKGTESTKVAAGHPDKVADGPPPCCSAHPAPEPHAPEHTAPV